jgi:hypothetical protein
MIKTFLFWNFGFIHWNLFVIWILLFGAYPPERQCRTGQASCKTQQINSNLVNSTSKNFG